MLENLKVRFRKEREGAEANLVRDFLGYCDNLFGEEGLRYTILTELYAEVGVPDILIVAWDSEIKDNYWSPERNKLVKKDIKILHHISSSGKRGVKTSRLSEQLGFENNRIDSSLRKLIDANLISIENNTAKITNFDNAFFVKKIISIEAKMKNWRIAFDQARLNENFSSHSYVLLPNDAINENTVCSAKGNIGLLAHHGESAIFKRKAKQSKLPGSYFSWVINEYVGRQFMNVSQTQ